MLSLVLEDLLPYVVVLRSVSNNSLLIILSVLLAYHFYMIKMSRSNYRHIFEISDCVVLVVLIYASDMGYVCRYYCYHFIFFCCVPIFCIIIKEIYLFYWLMIAGWFWVIFFHYRTISWSTGMRFVCSSFEICFNYFLLIFIYAVYCIYLCIPVRYV